MSLFNIGRLLILSETLTGARTITLKELHDNSVMALDPGGSNRTVTLPSDDDDLDGEAFLVENTADAEEIITLVNGTPTTLCTITKGESALVYYRGSPSGGWKATKLDANVVTAGTVVASRAVVVDANKDVTGFRNVTSTGTVAAANVSATNGIQVSAVAVTATTGGGTTGLIPAGASHATITSDSANKQVSLPAASIGNKLTLFVGANGCELISAVAAHEVNDVVVGATNELALGADTSYHCEYVATNKWIVRGFTKLGADAAALIPDGL